ncbi:MAG: hypothetical protein KIH64_008330 [Mycobacterium sp.]|nr:hypothetical protein [Mycobacterium sp.]
MSTKATQRAGLLTTIVTAGALALGIASAPAANAADGCAQGYSPNGGVCLVNAPGPWAKPDPDNPQCWFQSDGLKRCYPGADVFK